MRYPLKIIITAIIVFACGCAWKYVYQVPNSQDETHFCRTKDGWDLALFRFRPELFNPEHYPVILCHGLGNNSYVWDIDKRRSFASYLREKGYDVWALSLRGSGKSTRPGIGGLSKVAVLKRPLEERYTYNPLQFDWNIDDHIDKDLPAAIEYVKKKTGKDKVIWIGHSLGGMIMCAYLEKYGGRDVHALACIGSPMIFLHPLNAILKEVQNNKDIIKASVLVNIEVGAQIGAPLGGQFQEPSDILTYNRDNMSPWVISSFLTNAVDDISGGVVNQYLAIIDKEQFMSADKKYNYTANLNKIKTPVLFVGGKVDNLTPPISLLYAYYNVGSTDKTVRIFGKQNFCKTDYGHVDIIIGDNAPKEVYPYICGWLDERPMSGKKETEPLNVNKETLDFFQSF